MKVLVVFCISAMWLSADGGQAKKAARPAPAPARVVKPLEIPKGAVETADGTYRYTDTAGKKWIYRKTPFGVSRVEESAVTERAKAAPEAGTDIRAIEEGDMIRFEKRSPFGVQQWKSKKSELNELEKAAWSREQAKAAAKKD